MLSGYYQKYVAIKKMELQQHAHLKEAVSTSRMHNVICVPNNNAKFEEFRNLVDLEIKNAIYSLYGQYSEFTQPIITQPMLCTIENTFQRLLPIQYHCIRSMMVEWPSASGVDKRGGRCLEVAELVHVLFCEARGIPHP